MYHASTTTDISSFIAGSCFVDSAEVAETFLNNNAGRVYEVIINSSNTADAEDLRDAGAEVGLDEAYLFELADDSAVRALLASKGYDTVTYDDVTVDNADEFTCVRTLVDGIASIVA